MGGGGHIIDTGSGLVIVIDGAAGLMVVAVIRGGWGGRGCVRHWSSLSLC